ncbi:DUF2866 domain-containing protein [Caballeronia sp. LZ034LL]|uniref:DUF2866 domain-containing protein n=1 Tax=Caballeronia sp. LZ034LL TaxID=3038567 RepID=UPI00285A79AB|nr:DUF2866 domain-containing protein [Caballeronia sp. LZ034LL]MDR5839235.1 DUF2866 domain-containing protein [Caballeronia sp. LZ034LL]
MPANTTARPSFANLAPTLRKKHALALRRCRLSAPVEPLFGPAYRMVEWENKNDPRVQCRIFPANCTSKEIAEALRAHVPGRRYGPVDEDA